MVSTRTLAKASKAQFLTSFVFGVCRWFSDVFGLTLRTRPQRPPLVGGVGLAPLVGLADLATNHLTHNPGSESSAQSCLGLFF